MKRNNFEEELPEGYELKLHIDASKGKKTVALYTVLSFLPMIITVAVALVIVKYVRGWDAPQEGLIDFSTFITLLLTCVLLFAYVVLHELVHGITYKVLTGGKLTFGLKRNVAFCGMPNIYVYRKAAKIAILMPFLVFNIVFTGLTVGMYFVSALAFLAAALILGLHIGGCVGDLHVTYMLDHKFKDKRTLIRDTGSEQFFYVYTGTVNSETFE